MNKKKENVCLLIGALFIMGLMVQLWPHHIDEKEPFETKSATEVIEGIDDFDKYANGSYSRKWTPYSESIKSAGRFPDAYLAHHASVNGGKLMNPANIKATVSIQNASISPQQVVNSLQRCIVGVVGITPIPTDYTSEKDDVDKDIKSVAKNTKLFEILSQTHGISFMVSDTATLNGVGSNSHPIAVSTKCMALLYAGVKSFIDYDAADIEIRNAMADKAKKDNDALINQGEVLFESSKRSDQSK